MKRSPAAVDRAGDLQRFKAAFFRALGHPLRIRILEVLYQPEAQGDFEL